MAILVTFLWTAGASAAIWDSGATDRLWNSGLNWDTDLVPVTGETVKIGADGLTADVNGPLIDPNHTSTGTGEAVAGRLIVGTNDAGTWNLDITGGVLTAGELWVCAANASDVNGVVTQNGGTVTSNSVLLLGKRGYGVYNLDGGTLTAPSGMNIGAESGFLANGEFNMTDGTLDTTGANLSVGHNDQGILNIDGGTVTGKNFMIGGFGSASGVGEVVQTGGTVEMSTWGRIGDKGNGTYTITGGSAIWPTANQFQFVPYSADATGEINVGGTGYMELKTLLVGHNSGSIGTVNISGGKLYVRTAFKCGANGGNAQFNISGGILEVAAGANWSLQPGNSVIDITYDGKLIFGGDLTSNVENWISDGRLVAWGGNRGEVLYEVVDGNTVITASDVDVNKAAFPSPDTGAEEVSITGTVLSWLAGEKAADIAGHEVYLSTDYEAVEDRDASAFVGALDSNSYDPGQLLAGTTYYWRVDEVNSLEPNSPWEGDIWEFTTSCTIIDDFDGYPAIGDLAAAWDDGIDSGDNGGSEFFVEQIEAEDGNSMQIDYDNTSVNISEVDSSSLISDLTADGEKAIYLSYLTQSGNSSEPIYMSLSDGTNTGIVRITDRFGNVDGEATYAGEFGASWQTAYFALEEFTDDAPSLDLSNIQTIAFGIGDPEDSGYTGGTGTIYIDNLILCGTQCVPSMILSDIVGGDCVCDFADLGVLSSAWLQQGGTVSAQTPSTDGLLLHYKFDETSGTNVNDEAGSNDGTIDNTPVWDTTGGYDGGCLDFDGSYAVDVPNDVFNNVDDAITISVWVNGDTSAQPATDTQAIFRGVTPDSSGTYFRVLSALVPFETADGEVIVPFDAGITLPVTNTQDRATFYPESSSQFEGKWNHYAFVKDASQDFQAVYFNGEKVAENLSADLTFEAGITDFVVGAKLNAALAKTYYEGKLDEFKIYNRALSQAEIVGLAGKSSVDQELLTEAEIVENGTVDFQDYSVIADEFLETVVWP